MKVAAKTKPKPKPPLDPASIVAELAAMPGNNRGVGTFLDRLTDSQRAALAAIREAYRGKQFRRLSQVELHRLTCERLGLNIGRNAFLRYLTEGNR